VRVRDFYLAEEKSGAPGEIRTPDLLVRENIVPELCGDRMRVGVKKATGDAEETGGAIRRAQPRVLMGGSTP